MGGEVFVVQGDITQIHADAVVLSTSTQLDGGGLAQQSYLAHFGEAFRRGFAAIRDSHPHGPDGRRVQTGEAFWIPLGGGGDRPRGIVVVVATGREHRIEQRAQLAVRGAMAEARRRLRELCLDEKKPPGPTDRWLIAFPTVGLGWRPNPAHGHYRLWERLAQGCGDTRERRRLLRRALAVAEEEGVLANLRRRLEEGAG